jgi:hypothetical protein
LQNNFINQMPKVPLEKKDDESVVKNGPSSF